MNDWIMKDKNRKKSMVFICPECGEMVYFPNNGGAGCPYPFCPWCKTQNSDLPFNTVLKEVLKHD